MRTLHQQLKMYFTLFVILLFTLSPLASAVSISDVSSIDISDDSATISWVTDEKANSFVKYGSPKPSIKVGDAKAKINHQINLKKLSANTTYLYQVESGGVIDDNNKSFHSFTTLPPFGGVTLTVNVSDAIEGYSLSLFGTSDLGATIKVFINKKLQAQAIVSEKAENSTLGTFAMGNILLIPNEVNILKVEASFKGKTSKFEKKVISDSLKPQLITEPSLYTSKKAYTFKANLSEKSSYEIFVNNKSTKKGSGITINQKLNLKKGKNNLSIFLTDSAGLSSEQKYVVTSDPTAPQVTFDVGAGHEFFQGNAKSPISGTTKPGAKVLLFIYNERGFKFKPKFDDPKSATVADEEGKFTFENIVFSTTFLDISAKDLVPREVPGGLKNIVLPTAKALGEEAQHPYHIYIIVEDKAGRVAYGKDLVTVKSCSSTGLDFSIENVGKSQLPLKLVPSLIEQGRQTIMAMFKLEYHGQGQAIGNDPHIKGKAYRILGVPTIESACTPSMAKDDWASIGCKIIPRKMKGIASPSGEGIFLQTTLFKTDQFSKLDPDILKNIKDRVVQMPLRITLRYQEKKANGEWTQTKTQRACTTLGYFVDPPANANEWAPDFFYDGLDVVLNETVNAIETIQEPLEDVYGVLGASCTASWASRLVLRGSRIFMSWYESGLDTVAVAAGKKKQHEACLPLIPIKSSATGPPSPPQAFSQYQLYLESDIKDFFDMPVADRPRAFQPGKGGAANLPDARSKHMVLDDRCKSTAAIWKAEKVLNKIMQWTCDRAICRTAPARWTEDQDVADIDRRELKQNQCAITGKGRALTKINAQACRKQVAFDPPKFAVSLPQFPRSMNDIGDCWQTPQGDLYAESAQPSSLARDAAGINKKNIYTLYWVGHRLANKATGATKIGPNTLQVLKPKGGHGFIMNLEDTCQKVCSDPRKPGFISDGCYQEKIDGSQISLYKGGNKLANKDSYSAGYTKDCFIGSKVSPPALPADSVSQCVCKKQQAAPSGLTKAQQNTEAGKKEFWSYHQEQVNRESSGSYGRFYPKQRYYDGRDFSMTFGFNQLSDAFASKGQETTATLNPYSQLLTPYQTACLPQILKQTQMIKVFAKKLRECAQKARTSEFEDMGSCKTFFTQEMCGLAFKAIAAAQKELMCSPVNFDEASKGGEISSIGFFTSKGPKAFSQALSSSVSDAQQDYGTSITGQAGGVGSEGLSQSICMGVLTGEWPMFSPSAYVDQVYELPGPSVPWITTASREFSSYNPVKQQTVHNYRVGASVMPGCRLQSARVSLKCIGPEDRGREGVDETCGQTGCDCLNIQSDTLQSSNQRQNLLVADSRLAPSQMHDFKIPAVVPVTSPYRYDHVVMELVLDPQLRGQEEKCFPEESIVGNRAIIYEPLSTADAPVQFDCSASLVTGKFQCSALAGQLGFGGAGIEQPYVQCYDKREQIWKRCTEPNTFILGDDLKTRVMLNLDGKAMCLKRTVSGVQMPNSEVIRPIPAGQPGQLQYEDHIGTVDNSMFTSVDNKFTVVKDPSSNNKCSTAVPFTVGTSTIPSVTKFRFEWTFASSNKMRIKVPAGASPQGNYKVPAGGTFLEDTTKTTKKDEFTVSEANKIKFNLGGFEVTKVFNNVNIKDTNKQCTYVIQQKKAPAGAEKREFRVRYELLQPDAGGTCFQAKVPILKSNFGLQQHSQKVLIQKALSAFQQGSGLHGSWTAARTAATSSQKQKYQALHIQALSIENQKKNDIQNAMAIYYDVAQYVEVGKLNGAPKQHQLQIETLFEYFFKRNWGGLQQSDYPPTVKSTNDFKKIKKYLCETDKKLGAKYQADC